MYKNWISKNKIDKNNTPTPHKVVGVSFLLNEIANHSTIDKNNLYHSFFS